MSIGLSNINRPMQSKFRIRTTRLFLTYPQCPIKKEEALTILQNLSVTWTVKIKNYVIAEEEHITGEPHLHAYLEFDKIFETVRPEFADMKAVVNNEVMNYHGNYQAVRSVQNVIKYCTKKENFLTNFTEEEMRIKCKISKTEQAMKELMSGADLAETVEKNPTLLTMIGKIKTSMTIYQSIKAKKAIKPQICGKWVWGEPGVGKSHFVRSLYPNAYLKGCNKWWDDFSGEEVVIMEEITREHSWLFPLILLWTDKWDFRGEIKGGSVAPHFRKFIITSNYSIDEVFAEIPAVSLAALKRRFVILKIEGTVDEPMAYWEKPGKYEDSMSQKLWENCFDKKEELNPKPQQHKTPDSDPAGAST